MTKQSGKKPTVPLSALDTNSVLSSLRNYRMWSTEAYTGHLEYFISFNGSNILPGEASSHPSLTTQGWQTLLTEAVWLAQVGKFISGRNGAREQVHLSLIPHLSHFNTLSSYCTQGGNTNDWRWNLLQPHWDFLWQSEKDHQQWRYIP